MYVYIYNIMRVFNKNTKKRSLKTSFVTIFEIWNMFESCISQYRQAGPPLGPRLWGRSRQINVTADVKAAQTKGGRSQVLSGIAKFKVIFNERNT